MAAEFSANESTNKPDENYVNGKQNGQMMTLDMNGIQDYHLYSSVIK